jgi:hypothetical protein
MKFFITFSSHNKTVAVISDTCHTQRPFSDSPYKQLMPTLDLFGIQPNLHRCGLQ